MTVGSELRQARERAGLSAEQMSERTKIQLYKIDALEQDDFSRLPQGIYLDGIVRAYAHEVGTDPEPIVERVRLQRGKLPGDWEVPFAAPIELYPAASDRRGVPALEDIPVLGESQGVDGLDAFSAESDLAAAPKMRPEHRVLLSEHREHRDDPRDLRDDSRGDDYVAVDDLPLSVSPPVSLPARTRQRSGLALPLLILLAAAGLGVFFYQSAQSLDRDAAARRTAESRPAEASNAPTPFSENVITPEADPRPTATAGTSAVRRDTPGNSSTGSASVSAAPARPVESTSAAAATPAERPERIDAPGTSPDVTGSWRLATQVESSSLPRFAGLKLGYEMQLEQDGDRVTGTGRKVTENGNGIGRRAQTPVTVSGTIDGDRLTLNFVERGARRATQGKFVLMVDDARTLRGRFSSNAARSSGIVEAHRVQ